MICVSREPCCFRALNCGRARLPRAAYEQFECASGELWIGNRRYDTCESMSAAVNQSLIS